MYAYKEINKNNFNLFYIIYNRKSQERKVLVYILHNIYSIA